ncbi:unnamed protein product [Symbiodinium natans]|uniref:Uncharacterized protein n=1 Tax=Symbiodinium natans TaxID=878477 RepID=A0A812UZP7_9DINO|nr:unnamed protein product [Symbiodinium natans]
MCPHKSCRNFSAGSTLEGGKGLREGAPPCHCGNEVQMAVAGGNSAAILLLEALAASAIAITTRSESSSGGNPIRKVVRMMQKMGEKIDKEAKTEADLYEKFECYCKGTIAELQQSIQQAEGNPLSQADVDGKVAEIDSLQQEVTKLKEDRLAEEESLKAAKAQRTKEHGNFVNEVTEEKQVVATIDKAAEAIAGTTETAASFLQIGNSDGQVPRLLRLLDSDLRLDSADKRRAAAFLQGDRSAADPGMVVGMLSGIKDETKEEIATETKTEEDAEETFTGVKTSKKVEISTLLNQFERKMKRIGELKVEVVNLERQLAEQGNSLEDDKKMLAEVQKSCAKKAEDWEKRTAARKEEQLALQETIKILDSDESLDLFRKRSPSLLQLSSSREKVRREALGLIRRARRATSVARSTKSERPELNFLALALSGRKVDFTKILTKIDGMVALLEKEQEDDKTKQSYCGKEFRSTEEKSKTLDSKIKSLKASLVEKKEAIAKLSEDIEGLQKGVTALDESVAKASENRKAEHAEFQESMSSNSASVDLLSLARDRLNKLYNPTMVAETTTKSPYDLSFLQMSKIAQPPPTFEGGYQKNSEGSNGVLKMIDTLASDIEKEMAVAKTEEADAQEEYETTVQDAAKKRAADLELATQKAAEKSDIEGDISDDKKDVDVKKKQLGATEKYTADLHEDCDWLLKNFDLRAQARTEEKESLIRAKTVLAGM